ncbi:MAG: solute:sodium symporter family transporter [Planctomycetota bacterium]|nr:MAG: solute:sodium symporter family transporter [Planctomycetota bacterium]
MQLTTLDVLTFVAFLALVVFVSLWASRKEKSGEDYFLAGRKLTWPLIGFSLIASNISTEHFVGMAGSAFGRIGLAIASYEWMAAITLVIVAWWLLPKFLKCGIYTMPEYLEYRYDGATRSIMAVYLMLLYVLALLATVLYSGAQGLNGIFGFPEMMVDSFGMSAENAVYWSTVAGAWFIGIVAAIYTVYGGLKAVVWSDLLQGAALLIGGALVLYLGLKIVGGGSVGEDGGVVGGSVMEGWRIFSEQNADKLHVVLPWNDPDVPWLAVFVGGLWIPNLFYWGLNQFITQRTLGAKSLAEGQRGIFLACFFKLLIPFIIVIPGIIAFQLYGDAVLAKAGGDVAKAGELAYPHLIATIMPPVLRGVMLAALAGAVMSSFNSGINSAATIYTIDIYKRYLRPNAETGQQMRMGRIATAVIAIAACLIAPLPGSFEGVFAYIQEIWGFISPGIVAAFLFGILLPRAPVFAGKLVLLLGPLLYAICRVPKWVLDGQGYKILADESGSRVVQQLGTEQVTVEGPLAWVYSFNNLAFLHHMALVFLVLAAVMLLATKLKPLAQPVSYPNSGLDVRVPMSSYVLGSLIIAATVLLYVLFW